MKEIAQNSNPPIWLDRFLEWYCAQSLIDEIQGDLYEGYKERLQRLGKAKSNWWYFINVLRFFRPSSFGKRKTQIKWTMMYVNNLKIAFRNFSKHRSFTAINIFGLVLGTASCLLITLHVLEEISYDSFHPDTDNTYRVTMDMYNNGSLSANSAPVYPAVGPGLVNDFPEVLDFVRILPFGDGVYSVKKEDGSLIRFNEDRAVFADENFFKLFGFKLVGGDPSLVLSEKNQIVLSESSAKKYFGESNPIGKSITYVGREELIVTGIMEDFPENSHMQFDMISSIKTWNSFDEWPQNWGWYDFYTFIKVQPDIDIQALSEKVGVYLDEKKAEDYEKESAREILQVQNVADIHLHAKGLSWDMGENGGANRVYFLSAIAILILVIAWVNFINLTTARAIKRAREVGIRKVVGAQRPQLIQQFMTEAFLFNFIAILISIGLVILLVPAINNELNITLDRSLLASQSVLKGLIVLLIIGTVISGFYPALVLSSFRPISVLKGTSGIRKSRFGFRHVLVTFQFIISIVLIIGTMITVKQLKFMQNQDLGLNVDQTLVLKAPSSSRHEGDLSDRRKIFTNGLQELSSIRGFTTSNVVPGVENFSISSFNTREYPNINRDCYRVRVDENYFEQFEVELLAGRNFSKDMPSDSVAVLLNSTAVKLFGFESPEKALGERLNPNSDWAWKIIGVVEDYHHASLKESLDPMMFYYRPNSGSFFSLKIQGADVVATIKEVEEVWDAIYPDNPFDFFFLDEHFNKQYTSDLQFNAVFIGFALLAILVACLGLFGLVSFSVEQSRKEIGIRKVLGASVSKIVLIISREYMILIGFAIVTAFPLGYFLMKSWLQDFAYQTVIGPLIFIGGAVIALLVTFLTVSSKSISAAKANPVESLREE